MMENSRYGLLDDKRFKDELDECYFHPSRKYASEEIKFIARNAMLLLWDMDGISVDRAMGAISGVTDENNGTQGMVEQTPTQDRKSRHVRNLSLIRTSTDGREQARSIR